MSIHQHLCAHCKRKFTCGCRTPWRRAHCLNCPRLRSVLPGARKVKRADRPVPLRRLSDPAPGVERPTAAAISREGEYDWRMRDIEVEAREYRESTGQRRLRYTWHQITGPCPRVKWGDRNAAKDYLDRLLAAMDTGGWNHSELAGLYIAIKRWAARAQGLDHRYNLVGNRQGGLDEFELKRLRELKGVEDDAKNGR